MKISVIRWHGRSWVARGILFLLFSSLVSLRAQPVTIDFTTPSLTWLSAPLPWHEDGFTVASLTQVGSPQFPLNSNPRVIVGNKLSPYGGYLQFLSENTNPVVALITNDAQRAFDLLSLDVILLRMYPTNLARISSSAGGTYDLFGASDESTLLFSGPQWESLSYLRIEFQSPLFGATTLLERLGMGLDNIVLRPVVVPEPTGLGLIALLGLGLAHCSSWRRG